MPQIVHFGGELRRRKAAATEHPVETALSRFFDLVSLGEPLGSFLIIATQRFVGIVGNALFQCLQVEDAEQAVAALDIGVKRAKRFPRFYSFDPEGYFCEFNGHWISVDAMNAIARDVAHRGGIIGCVVVAKLRHPRRHAPRGAQEKVTRAAGWS